MTQQPVHPDLDHVASDIAFRCQPGVEWEVHWDSNNSAAFKTAGEALDAIRKKGVAVWFVERKATFLVKRFGQ